MTQTKSKVAVGMLVCLMMVLSGIVGHAQAGTITMKWANFMSPTSAPQIYLNKVAEAVERRAGGQVKIEIFPGGSLVRGRQMLEAVRTGLADVGFVMPSYFPAEFPLGNYAYEVPLGVTLDSVFPVLDEARPLIEEECAANGLRYLECTPLRHEWYFNRRINLDVPDWSGLKVRPLGGLVVVMAKKLGAGCVSMSSSEAVVALNTKVIDGIATSISSYRHLKMYKDAPYVFVTNAMIGTVNIWAFSLDRWNTLPKNVQDIISQEFKRLRDEWWLDYTRKENETALKACEKEGAVMMVPTSAQMKVWQEKMQSTWAVLPEKAGAKGQKYLDIVKKHLK